MSIPVIDMWAPIVPSDEIIEDLQSGFPTEQLQYLEVFTKTTVSDEQFGSYAQALRRSDDQILAALDEAGITHSLITGFDERSTCGVTFVHNESVAALAGRHPELVYRVRRRRRHAGECGAEPNSNIGSLSAAFVDSACARS